MECFTVSYSSDLTCSSQIFSKKLIPTLKNLNAYHNQSIFLEGLLFNAKELLQIITVNKAHNSLLAFGFDYPFVIEELDNRPLCSINCNGYTWQEFKINEQDFYKVGIRNDFLFQCRLLSIQYKLNTVTITSNTMSLITYLKYTIPSFDIPKNLSLDMLLTLIKASCNDYCDKQNIKNSLEAIKSIGLGLITNFYYEIH